MNIISIYGGHNATVVFNNHNTYHVIELERLMKQRYYMLFDKSPEEFISVMQKVLEVAKKFWRIENDFDVCVYGVNGATHLDYIPSVIKTKKIVQLNHHLSHAACAYYQSPRPSSPLLMYDRRPNDIIISFDGGGNDGVFNVYSADRKTINPRPIFKSDLNLGHAYMLTGYPIKELKGIKGRLPNDLALAGKMMGLVAYGNVRNEWLRPMLDFYRSTGEWSLQKLGDRIGVQLGVNTIDGQTSYDFAATSQRAFEMLAIDLIMEVKDKFNPDFICLSGGCALNVLLNEKLAREYGWGDDFLFIPPNPDDGGLAVGQHFLINPPIQQVNLKFSGLPLLDRDDEENCIKTMQCKKMSYIELAKYLRDGKIVGLVDGDSEVGPRALGHRSIICDPRIAGMKDILNSKVKFREWFRPFAPVARQKDAAKYFELGNSKTFKNHEFMSFAPLVKEDYKSILSEITHEDNSSRLQIVDDNDGSIFTAILDAFEKMDPTKPAVLLNTSLNIKGFPILSTLEDAFKILKETKLDAIYYNGYLYY